MIMKIAVCSSDGQKVDLHFGKTDEFYIFEITGGAKVPLGKRAVPRLSPAEGYLVESGETHDFDQDQFDLVSNAIKDCKEVYTTRIGAVPEAKLLLKGIGVRVCNCPVDQIPGCDHNCQ